MKYRLKNDFLDVRFQALGGALTSIRDYEGTEYLWQGDPAYWSGQAPVLFPICGSIRDDHAVTRNGKQLHMPRHGIVRKKEFVCTEQTDEKIVFMIENDRSMFEQYPYAFRLEIEYTLLKQTIRTKYRVINLGDETMPFLIGGHPGFCCPIYRDEHYDDYYIEFAQNETCDVPLPISETGLIDVSHRKSFLKDQDRLMLTHTLFEKDAVILDQLKSRRIRLLSKNHRKGIQLEFADFPYLILWSSANQGPFIALEPWIGLSTCSDEGDLFEEKRNMQNVKCGDIKEYTFDISVLG